MPPPLQPIKKAKIAGRDVINPGRFNGRREPECGPLGDAPNWMTEKQAAVWFQMGREIPWLNESHRSLLGIAVTVQARLVAGEEVGVQALNLLRQCLGQMGATPADATKVSVPDGREDPEEAFFKRPN